MKIVSGNSFHFMGWFLRMQLLSRIDLWWLDLSTEINWSRKASKFIKCPSG